MTEVFTVTQTSELDVELTVFKNCDPLFPPSVQKNPDKNADY